MNSLALALKQEIQVASTSEGALSSRAGELITAVNRAQATDFIVDPHKTDTMLFPRQVKRRFYLCLLIYSTFLISLTPLTSLAAGSQGNATATVVDDFVYIDNPDTSRDDDEEQHTQPPTIHTNQYYRIQPYGDGVVVYF